MIREGTIRLPFRYAAGQAASRFFIALQERNVILGSRCSACRRVLAPARSFCPTCAGSALETTEIGPGGVLASWTSVPGRGTFGLVLLDGADTAMLHLVLAEPEELHCGLRVRARFADAPPERPFDALAGFTPERAAA